MSKNTYAKCIILIELFIYFYFLIKYRYTNNVEISIGSLTRYIYIILCLILSLLIENDCYSTRDKSLLQLSLFLTCIADFFLVIRENYKPGVFVFIFVQITYIVRHSRNPVFLVHHVYSILFPIATLLLIGYLFKPTYIDTTLYMLSFCYVFFLLYSLVSAFSTLNNPSYNKISSYMIILGICLFFLCDLNVALNTLLGESFKITKLIISFDFLIWFFYLPSQLLLALSGYKNLPK